MPRITFQQTDRVQCYESRSFSWGFPPTSAAPANPAGGVQTRQLIIAKLTKDKIKINPKNVKMFFCVLFCDPKIWPHVKPLTFVSRDSGILHGVVKPLIGGGGIPKKESGQNCYGGGLISEAVRKIAGGGRGIVGKLTLGICNSCWRGKISPPCFYLFYFATSVNVLSHHHIFLSKTSQKTCFL